MKEVKKNYKKGETINIWHFGGAGESREDVTVLKESNRSMILSPRYIVKTKDNRKFEAHYNVMHEEWMEWKD